MGKLQLVKSKHNNSLPSIKVDYNKAISGLHSRKSSLKKIKRPNLSFNFLPKRRSNLSVQSANSDKLVAVSTRQQYILNMQEQRRSKKRLGKLISKISNPKIIMEKIKYRSRHQSAIDNNNGSRFKLNKRTHHLSTTLNQNMSQNLSVFQKIQRSKEEESGKVHQRANVTTQLRVRKTSNPRLPRNLMKLMNGNDEPYFENQFNQSKSSFQSHGVGKGEDSLTLKNQRNQKSLLDQKSNSLAVLKVPLQKCIGPNSPPRKIQHKEYPSINYQGKRTKSLAKLKFLGNRSNILHYKNGNHLISSPKSRQTRLISFNSIKQQDKTGMGQWKLISKAETKYVNQIKEKLFLTKAFVNGFVDDISNKYKAEFKAQNRKNKIQVKYPQQKMKFSRDSHISYLQSKTQSIKNGKAKKYSANSELLKKDNFSYQVKFKNSKEEIHSSPSKQIKKRVAEMERSVILLNNNESDSNKEASEGQDTVSQDSEDSFKKSLMLPVNQANPESETYSVTSSEQASPSQSRGSRNSIQNTKIPRVSTPEFANTSEEDKLNTHISQETVESFYNRNENPQKQTYNNNNINNNLKLRNLKKKIDSHEIPYILPKKGKWSGKVKFIGRTPGQKIFRFQKNAMAQDFKHQMRNQLKHVKEFQKWDRLHSNMDKESKENCNSSLNAQDINYKIFDREIAKAVEELKTKNLYTEGKEQEIKRELRSQTFMTSFSEKDKKDYPYSNSKNLDHHLQFSFKKKRSQPKRMNIDVNKQQSFNSFLNQKSRELIYCKFQS